jgi:hypothetical protein
LEDDVLSLSELRQLRHDSPGKLFQHLREVERDFVFGVEDHREEREEWGGEFRVLVNRNIELHLVPRFNPQMESIDELPQYVIMPDNDLAGTEAEREITIDDEGETVPAVIFYVEPDRYDRLVDELGEVVERYDDFDVIPDTYFLETELVHLISTRILEHEVVKEERAYDFRRGLVGGEPPPLPDDDEGSSDLDHGAPPSV